MKLTTNFFDKAYFIFLICTILPANGMFGINIKMIMFTIIIAGLIIYSLRNKVIVDSNFMKFFTIIIFVSIWFAIGIFKGYHPTAKLQLISFLSLFLPIITTYLLLINKLINIKLVIKNFYFIMFAGILGKVFIEVLLLVKLLNAAQLYYIYNVVFNANPMGMVIPFINWSRIQTPSDFIPIILMGFYLIDKNKTAFNKLLLIAISTAYVIIVYSRIMTIYYLLIILFVLLIKIKNSISMNIYKFSSLLIIISILTIAYNNLIINNDEINNSIKYRFQSQATRNSDQLRDIQSIYLLKEFRENWAIGKGLGSYSKDYIRSSVVKFTYEKEYLSFLMQLGILGFIAIIISSILLFLSIIFKNRYSISLMYSKEYVLIIFNFFIWVTRPLYNPYFLSSNSGMVIVILIVMSSYFYKKQLLENQINEKKIISV